MVDFTKNSELFQVTYNFRTSPYHYIPSEGVAITFIVLFGLSTVLHLGQATFYRMWWLFPTMIGLCGLLEVVGWPTLVTFFTVTRGEMTHKIRLMVVALCFSTLCLLIRGIYRTIELANGWDGRIISTQVLFNVLDGAMITLAMYTMNIAHPGLLLGRVKGLPKSGGSSVSEVKF